MLTHVIQNVTKVGLGLVAWSLTTFAFTVWLANSCYYTATSVVMLISFIGMIVIAFSPTILAYICAVDVLLYFNTVVEDRGAKFRGTVIRTYMRYVTLATAVYATSLLRQVSVMMFTDQRFSYTSLALPFYLIIIRKQIFGGKLEEYLARYVWTSLLVAAAALVFMEVFGRGFSPEHSCRMQRLFDAARSAGYLN